MTRSDYSVTLIHPSNFRVTVLSVALLASLNAQSGFAQSSIAPLVPALTSTDSGTEPARRTNKNNSLPLSTPSDTLLSIKNDDQDEENDRSRVAKFNSYDSTPLNTKNDALKEDDTAEFELP